MQVLRKLFNRARNYLKNTSLHGLKYTVDKKIPWIGRILWVAISATFLYYAWKLMNASWNLYKNESTTFGVETTFLDWNTTFPAISVCEDLFLRNIYSLQDERIPCEDLITDCEWLGKSFDCCANFLPVPTEYGVCFTLNSLQVNRSLISTKKIPMISNKSTGPGKLKFTRTDSIYLVIHSPEDVFNINYKNKNEFYLNPEEGSSIELLFQVTETVNDPDLKRVPIEKRECRFPDENPLTLYPYYSYSACIVECRSKAQVDVCGCYHHFLPDESPRFNAPACNETGLDCLLANYSHFETIQMRRTTQMSYEEEGIFCNCLPTCTEMEFSILMVRMGESLYSKLHEIGVDGDAIKKADVVISMNSLPSIRFSRNVVRDELTIIVDLGGIAGLFFGAGLLSIVEIIYYFCIRNPQREDKDDININNEVNRNHKLFFAAPWSKNSTVKSRKRLLRNNQLSFQRNILMDLYV